MFIISLYFACLSFSPFCVSFICSRGIQKFFRWSWTCLLYANCLCKLCELLTFTLNNNNNNNNKSILILCQLRVRFVWISRARTNAPLHNNAATETHKWLCKLSKFSISFQSNKVINVSAWHFRDLLFVVYSKKNEFFAYSVQPDAIV